jgi:hypothetical protein
VPAIREIADRIDGKVPRAVEAPAQITVVIQDLADTANDEDKARADALIARQADTGDPGRRE